MAEQNIFKLWGAHAKFIEPCLVLNSFSLNVVAYHLHVLKRPCGGVLNLFAFVASSSKRIRKVKKMYQNWNSFSLNFNGIPKGPSEIKSETKVLKHT